MPQVHFGTKFGHLRYLNKFLHHCQEEFAFMLTLQDTASSAGQKDTGQLLEMIGSALYRKHKSDTI
ncbi:hypothetical protein AB205_0181990 [Aquarana catesbeiana]|uniref:Uncharacterized protein n=1 Tax=Aquarana catesbeiana TaxID=8400 RepID=A0A2G9QK80_AQUCT|nr:hypothetical protein AB205_0181990 [Aquarana catesbeiana]